jgi:hypothetical protein
MKMKKRMVAMIGLLSLMLIPRTVSIQAAENPKVFMDVQEYKKEDKSLQVSCKMEKGDDVTNGKLRVFYDAEKLTLVSSETGEALSKGMLEVNDCLTGNKAEGEMVLAFASAQAVAAEGSLLDISFKLKDDVKEGDKITFQVESEKLAGEGGNHEASTPKIIYTVGGEHEEEGQNKDDGKDNKDDNKDAGKDNKDDGKTTTSGNDKKGNSSKTSGVKTGDESPVRYYLALGAGAVVVLLGSKIVLSRKSKNKGSK